MDNWIDLSQNNFIYYTPDCWAVLGQDLPQEGITLESGFVSGKIISDDGLRGFSMGICLNEPMHAGNAYTFTIDLGRSFQAPTLQFNLLEDMNFTLNGITDCEELSNYTFDENLCDQNLPFEQLASTNINTLDSGWNQLTFQIIPTTTVSAIFLGADCATQTENRQLANVFYDNIYVLIKKKLLTQISDKVSDIFEIRGERPLRGGKQKN